MAFPKAALRDYFVGQARRTLSLFRICPPHRRSVSVRLRYPVSTGKGSNAEALAQAQAPNGVDLRLDVNILSVATANPAYRVDQREAWQRARNIFPHLVRMEALYTNTGIETRYSCVPAEWCERPHSWEERTETYQHHALDLLQQVSVAALAEAGLCLTDVDFLVLNTITGLAVPSLDAKLMNRLTFRPNVERLTIFGLGCGGGVAGMVRAARLAQACPGATVLFLTVDLCSLCARPNDPSVAVFVAAALFGDGAAAVVLRNGASASGRERTARPARIVAAGEHCWRNTEHIMGWDVKDDGFGVVLSPQLPSLMSQDLRPALDAFLQRHDLKLGSFDGFLLHPGGRKILETAESALGIDRARLAHSWAVLCDYGNMSSVTAMFVLQRALRAGDRGRHLLAAFGPGFSAYFAALEL